MGRIRSGPETIMNGGLVLPLDLCGQVELARFQLSWIRDRLGEDVPIQRVEVLLALYLHGCMPQSDICKRCGMSKAAIHRAVTQLMKLGLMMKTMDAHDARRRQMDLTIKGRELIEEAFTAAMVYRNRLIKERHENEI